MITAPAPIIAAALPACPAFSENSARASANSFPISFARAARLNEAAPSMRSTAAGLAVAKELRRLFSPDLHHFADEIIAQRSQMS
jgi:hypothetical protein